MYIVFSRNYFFIDLGTKYDNSHFINWVHPGFFWIICFNSNKTSLLTFSKTSQIDSSAVHFRLLLWNSFSHLPFLKLSTPKINSKKSWSSIDLTASLKLLMLTLLLLSKKNSWNHFKTYALKVKLFGCQKSKQ